MPSATERFDSARVLAARPAKPARDPFVPHDFLRERERSAEGRIDDVAVVFLVNRECPYRCLMCDLWKYTTDERVPSGAIPTQIDHALERLPSAQRIKLYNAGNFFDPRAIPPEDHEAIATRVRPFDRLIVENHPRMFGPAYAHFRDKLDTELEVALGLETIDREILAALNKGMKVADFDRAVAKLLLDDVFVRAFILVQPPYQAPERAVDQALAAIEHAFTQGVTACSLIPTRAGNGAMEQLQAAGHYTPPTLETLERVLEAGIALGRGRVFLDLWDAKRFAACPDCAEPRLARLSEMNLRQEFLAPIACSRRG